MELSCIPLGTLFTADAKKAMPLLAAPRYQDETIWSVQNLLRKITLARCGFQHHSDENYAGDFRQCPLSDRVQTLNCPHNNQEPLNHVRVATHIAQCFEIIDQLSAQEIEQIIEGTFVQIQQLDGQRMILFRDRHGLASPGINDTLREHNMSTSHALSESELNERFISLQAQASHPLTDVQQSALQYLHEICSGTIDLPRNKYLNL